MKTTKLWAGAALLIIGGVAVASATASTLHAEKAECEIAADWVAANGENLPTTLREISTYPMAYRRAIHAALPKAVQMELWHDHIGTFLTAESTLTEEQRAFLKGVNADLAPYFEPATMVAADSALRLRMEASFTREEAVAIFGALGPIPNEVASGAQGVVAADKCECSRSSNYCLNSYCTAAAACEIIAGCGTFWQYDCDGKCGGGGPDT